MTVTDYDVRSLYLDLLRRNLTRYGMHERMPSEWPLRRRLLFKAVNTLHSLRNDTGQRGRELGLDWPAEAETMIGMQRLTSLQHCVETALAEDIPGDLIECGVWRGGACILMRAVLAAYGDETRSVWLADSFQGVPRSDPENYQADKGIRAEFACGHPGSVGSGSQSELRALRAADDQVRFLPGWFKDTLHEAPIDRIAVLRLDGDLYESTIQALDALYPRLSPGGFCVIDDYHREGVRTSCHRLPRETWNIRRHRRHRRERCAVAKVGKIGLTGPRLPADYQRRPEFGSAISGGRALSVSQPSTVRENRSGSRRGQLVHHTDCDPIDSVGHPFR